MASEELREAKATIDELTSKVDALERANRERAAVVDTLRTKLAMRERQLREADAELAQHRDIDRRLSEVISRIRTPVVIDVAPEPWEAIVTAAIRWRRGADRGELAAAVDAFTGDGPLDVQRRNTDPLIQKVLNSPISQEPMSVEGQAALERYTLRSEQYADGAGAQAWRQAMGGKT